MPPHCVMDRTVTGRCRTNGADDVVTDEHLVIADDSFLEEASPSAPAVAHAIESNIFHDNNDDGSDNNINNLKNKMRNESLVDEGQIVDQRESKQEPLLPKSPEKKALSATTTSSIAAVDQPQMSDASLPLANTSQLSPQHQHATTAIAAAAAQSCPSPVALRATSSRSQRQEPTPTTLNDPLLLPHQPRPNHSTTPDVALSHPTTKKRTKKEQSILNTTQLVLRHLQDDSAFFAQEAARSEKRRPAPPTTTRNIPVFDTHEIMLGSVLGHGEFGTVWEITSIRLKSSRPPVESYSSSSLAGSPTTRTKSIKQLPDASESARMSVSTRLHRRTPSTVTFSEDTKFPPQEIILRPSEEGDHDDSATLLDDSCCDDCEGGGLENANITSTFTEILGNGADMSLNAADDGERISLPTAPSTTFPATDDSDRPSLLSAESLSRLQKVRMAIHCQRHGVSRYALKRIRDDISPDSVLDAAIDLACEAQFLRFLQHPNLIHIRGTVGEPGTKEFAIVLDCLTQTLDQKLEEWQTSAKHVRGWMNGLFPGWGAGGASSIGGRVPTIQKSGNRKQLSAQELLVEQLLAAFDIARGMRYLHQHKILYRDLKPENIGFDVHRDVRIFDFGLAKELKPRDLVQPPDGYDATGLTGSRRYMAPECVCCHPYGLAADVYSFSILLWQIFSLQTPFPTWDARKHYEMVVERGKRPARLGNNVAPSAVRKLMVAGWSADASKRPTFAQICEDLQSEITDHARDVSVSSLADRSIHLLDHSVRSLAYLDSVDP